MKLTVVTAVRNAVVAGRIEKLRRCIESVSGICIPHEHLVYDGASDDGTVEVLKLLKMEFGGAFKWMSEPDHGIYEALNKGVRDAKGEWFYVLGCDDWISDPEALAKTLDKGGADDVLASPVVFANGEVWRPARKIIMAALPCSHQGLLVRSAIMRELGGFSLDFRLVADFDLMQRLALEGYVMKEFARPYATYELDGASSDSALLRSENAKLLKRRFKLEERELAALWPERVLPWHAFSPYLLSWNQWLRNAAWYQLLRLIAFRAGLIRIGRGVAHA